MIKKKRIMKKKKVKKIKSQIKIILMNKLKIPKLKIMMKL